MKIESAAISLSSSREYQEKNVNKLEVSFEWESILDTKLAEVAESDLSNRMSSEELSERSVSLYKEKLLYRFTERESPTLQSLIEESDIISATIPLKNQMIDSIFEKLDATNFFDFKFENLSYTYQNINLDKLQPLGRPMAFEMKYRMFEEQYTMHYEEETTTFVSDGMVKTADGREINFALNMEMNRSYMEESSLLHMEEGGYKFIDPLIINYQGNAPELADFTFNFDLNEDGETEELWGFKPGSGFLAFDLNEDGIINDGGELFGTESGDGFSDLSAYDEDNNNWIDENDSIFDKLTLWNRNAEGEDSMEKISDVGIGAISLLNTETPFDLRSPDNTLLARIQKTGVVINEDGSIGTAQQIDYTA